MRKFITIFCLITLGNSIFSYGSSSIALTDTTVLQEVSVTAIKQSRNLKEQPVAATVISGDAIELMKVDGVKDISEIAPNFYMPDYGSRMTSSIYVRGLGARIDQPVVGLNVDNIPFLNKDSYDFDLQDIERVEVLRGPQSTLYGRNTMGGLINIYTMSPLRYQGLRAMYEYGSYNSHRFSLSYYAKLSSRLGMSWNAYYTITDGFFDNAYNGLDCDTEKQGNFRWKTNWRMTDNVTMENVASFQLSRQGGYPYIKDGVGDVNYNDTCFYKRTTVNDGLTVKWITDKFTLSSITSFQYINDNMTLDQDFQPLEYFTLTQKRKEWAFTQDFVARGVIDDYSWLGGLFGFYKYTNMSAPVTFKEYGIEQLIEKNRNENNPYYPVEWNEETFVLGSDFTMPTFGIALYHQSSYDIKKWTISAGLRLDYERAQLNYNSNCNTSYTTWDYYTDPMLPRPYQNNVVCIDDKGELNQDFIQLLPKLSVSYKLTSLGRSMLYATVSKGYKAGGFNTQMFSDVLQQRIMGMMGLTEKYDVDDIVTYKPEISWNYELGTRMDLLKGKLNADVALFYIDCIDQQLTMFPDGTTTGRIMANAGKTRSYGVEFAMEYKPSERWNINVSYGYTDARFVDFDNGKEDFADNYIPYSPRNTFYVSGSYIHPLNLSWLRHVRLCVDVKGVGDIYWNETNDCLQPFYAQLGAKLRFEGERYSIDFWGENLTSTKFKTFYFVSIGNAFYQEGKPRRLGVTLRYNFEL